jgi:hypothetical protein
VVGQNKIDHVFWAATQKAFYANKHFRGRYEPYSNDPIRNFRRSFRNLLCKITGHPIVNGKIALSDYNLWHLAIDRVQAAPAQVVPAAPVSEAALGPETLVAEPAAPLFEAAAVDVAAPPVAPPILAPIIGAEGVNQVRAEPVALIAPAQVVPAAPVGEAAAFGPEAPDVELAAPFFEAAVEAPPIAPPVLAPIIGAEGPVVEPAGPIIAAAAAPILAEAAPLLAAQPVVAGVPMDMIRAIREQTEKLVREAAMERFAQVYVQTTTKAVEEVKNGP